MIFLGILAFIALIAIVAHKMQQEANYREYRRWQKEQDRREDEMIRKQRAEAQKAAHNQDNSHIKEFISELAAEKQAQETQTKAKEPIPPKVENKYTIYSCDEVPVIAKRVLDDMPSDIFGITLLSLKKSMLDKLTREKDDFKPGEDIRFFVYRAFYSHTYDLLLRDDCYFMGDFSEIGREVYRLCTFCLDESHRLGYVDDELYKAQRNNISINVRNGKEFS